MSYPFKRFLVTGGAGFIGSSFIRYGMAHIQSCEKIVNLDVLSYAADMRNLACVENDPRYLFVKGDIREEKLIYRLCQEHGIDVIVHFAAESHVDRSIAGPRAFFETNVGGTLSLLEVVRTLPHIHFHHISTDEVYGALTEEGSFTEASPYRPNSPYSASKAASDHFVRSYAHTYGLSTSISHCTNNYGPCQHVEKFIPRMIRGCLYKKPLTVYGTGIHVRDWIFVDDHSEALWMLLQHQIRGKTFGIGGGCERKNLDLLQTVIEIFSTLRREDPEKLCSLITFVSDRPGHDLRYAIDSSYIAKEIGWRPRHLLDQGLKRTIEWYLENPDRLEIR